MKTEEILNSFAETLADCIDNGDVKQIDIARATGIPSPHLTEMKKGRRPCTAEYDLRLSRYFGSSEGYWLRLQVAYQLSVARAKKGSLIKREVQPA